MKLIITIPVRIQVDDVPGKGQDISSIWFGDLNTAVYQRVHDDGSEGGKYGLETWDSTTPELKGLAGRVDRTLDSIGFSIDHLHAEGSDE